VASTSPRATTSVPLGPDNGTLRLHRHAEMLVTNFIAQATVATMYMAFAMYYASTVPAFFGDGCVISNDLNNISIRANVRFCYVGTWKVKYNDVEVLEKLPPRGYFPRSTSDVMIMGGNPSVVGVSFPWSAGRLTYPPLLDRKTKRKG
jgi:hypothetical protein